LLDLLKSGNSTKCDLRNMAYSERLKASAGVGGTSSMKDLIRRRTAAGRNGGEYQRVRLAIWLEAIVVDRGISEHCEVDRA